MPYNFCEKIGNEIRDISDEIPFDIPDSWEWCRLGTVFQHNTGKALNSSNHQGIKMQYITTSNLYWNRFELDKLKEMPFTNSEVEKCTVTKGDLLVCEGGDIGRAAIWNYDFPMRIQNHIHRLRPYFQVDVYYFYYLFFLYKSVGLIGGKGIGIQGLSSNALDRLLFPVPPFAEQKRIVAKIEELMPYIEKYEQTEKQLTKLNETFREMLKKSILQQAVQGKLVMRNPADEPASVLLERIREEKQSLIKAGKIKKDKHESVIITRDKIPYEITDGKERCIADEVPFEIPDSWQWVHLDYIAASDLGKTLDKAKNKGNFQPYLCSINVYWNGIDLSKVKEARFEDSELPKYLLKNGDLLICEGGEVGRCCVWDKDMPMYYQNALHRVRFYGNINPYYFKCLMELYKGIGIIEEHSKGVTIKHLVQKSLNSLYFPLPPLAEQNRIVSKIEEIMPIINTISK